MKKLETLVSKFNRNHTMTDREWIDLYIATREAIDALEPLGIVFKMAVNELRRINDKAFDIIDARKLKEKLQQLIG